MATQITNVSCDPPSPKAGKPFTLTVTLSSAAADVTVSIEKQRLVPGGGAFQTATIVGPYFAPTFEPKPILIRAGNATGTSDPIEVSRNAAVGDKPPFAPVVFPDHVLFTAYTDFAKNGLPFVVTIQANPLK